MLEHADPHCPGRWILFHESALFCSHCFQLHAVSETRPLDLYAQAVAENSAGLQLKKLAA